jgi:uncharacterized protein with von Willebrand factor type A (vWA) domain
MKYAQDIKRKESEIVEEEKKILQSSKTELDFLEKHAKVNEELIQKLGTLISQLQSLREGYIWRVIRSAKQNHMLD